MNIPAAYIDPMVLAAVIMRCTLTLVTHGMMCAEEGVG